MRGLKYCHQSQLQLPLYVALYMSAWIEIVIRKHVYSFVTIVALYMSAWIEILDPHSTFFNENCRTLHECVD